MFVERHRLQQPAQAPVPPTLRQQPAQEPLLPALQQQPA
jgi:hypothetical protein